MKTNMLKLLTLTLGLAAGSSAFGAGGNIWEILPCNEAGVTIPGPVASIEDPLGAGETIRFKIRFLRTADMKVAGRQWTLGYVGTGSSIVDDFYNPLKIGIYVSGELRYAEYEGDFGAANSDIHDFVFKYETRLGDFALPIRLSAGGAPVGFSDIASEYDLLNNEKWQIVDRDASGEIVNVAQFRFGDSPFGPPSGAGGSRVQDYSLAINAGFHVKTIDFNPSMDEEDVWRTIPSGSKRTTGINVQATAALTNAVTLYVWSKDEDVVKIVGKAPDVWTEHMIVGYAAGTPIYKDVTVGKLKINAGETTAGFSLQAGDVDHVNETTELVLSAFKNYFFDDANDLVPDYLTAVVKCGEPEPASVKLEVEDITIVADSDFLTAKTALTVSLNNYTPAAGEEVVVTITPSFDADPLKTDWANYVRFSTSDSEAILPSGDTPPTVVFDAAHTAPQTLYVYALRSDTYTVGTGHQVRFTPTSGTAGISRYTDTGVTITAAKPIVTAPTEGETYTVNAGEDLEINVCVADTYADLTDTDTGYELKIKIGSRTTTFPGRFFPTGEDNELRDALGNPPIVTIPDTETEGDKLATAVVTSPITQKKSETRNFVVHVNVQDQVHADVVLVGKEEGDNQYYEGDTVQFKIPFANNAGETAINPHGTTVYAFLVCQGDYDLAMFGGTKCIITDETVAAPDTVGRPVASIGNSATGSFQVLDGLSSEDGGMNYMFSVVFCESSSYDPARKVAEIKPGNVLDILVWNKEPNIINAVLNGYDSEENGATYNNQYPKGQVQRIQGIFDDVKYDLLHGFQYKWTAYRDGVAKDNGIVYHDDAVDVAEANNQLAVPAGQNINSAVFNYNFPQSGLWEIRFQWKDKDMTRWVADNYSFKVQILDTPQVMITPAESYSETETRAVVNVGLGYFESEDPIWVKITLTPPTGDNPGRFALDEAYKVRPDGTIEADPNVYYVSFDSAQDVPLGVSDLDGTLSTVSTKTFSMKAEVVSTEPSLDPTKTWAEYYAPYSTKIYIDNVAPVVVGCTEENTNAWKVAGGAATAYPIRWGIRSDVQGDMEGIASFPGIRITFLGCDNAETFYVGPNGDTTEMTGRFVPNFGSSQGDQTVTMTIEDKDGGFYTWTYLYTVEPSKFLKTYAHGPSAGTSTSKISQKYERLKNTKDGLGAGHTYVSGAVFSDAENFQLNWNCAKNVYMNVYGFGYKVVAPTDDGTLDNSLDKAIDVNGNAIGGEAVTNPYVYPTDDERDSFLYCWILTTLDENGAASDTILGETLAPETMGPPAIARVPLPTAETEDGSYVDTIVEAIFSKEFYPTDNLGDINQDAIPDAFAAAGWGDGLESLIMTVTGQAAIDGDSVDLAKSNPDNDYLPGAYYLKGEMALINNSQNSYAPIGHAFHTRRELRGLHDGLNETKLANGVPDFSDEEQKAYEATTGLTYDPATVDLNVWSPEPRGTLGAYRMDPTLEDTDADDMPDGWEYFFWYQAKVWVPAKSGLGKPRAGQTYVFERFNPSVSILVGTEITCDEVMERFNPCVYLDREANGFNPDFDRDGLTDLEELLIGTNPCHWDSDGDHMCDGWEVMNALDPINGNKNGNPDHDFMAAFTTYQVPFLEADPETETAFEGKAYVFDYLGLLDLDPFGRVKETQTVQLLFAEPFASPLAECPLDDDGNPIPSAYTYGLKKELPDGPKGPEDPDPRASSLLGFMMAKVYHPVVMTIPAGTQMNLNQPAFIADIETGEMIPDPEADTAFFAFVHDQVKEIFGFDPRTGWNKDANGYVASRWDPSVNDDLNPFDSTGVAVNTFPYSNYDEYLVMRYRHDFGISHADDVPWNVSDKVFETLRGFTTKPNVIYSADALDALFALAQTNDVGVSANDATNMVHSSNIAEQIAEALASSGSDHVVSMGHGADTDGDGVPDGWELYMGRNPNAAPSDKCETDGAGDDFPADMDGLMWHEEYAGTDSCNAYRSCESIYKNHPGLRTGWWNKFFPTDPDNADTDGDGIIDPIEGAAWGPVAFHNGGMVYAIDATFVYGEQTDNNKCCIRGGGLNPLTIDTDIDGLPDTWEAAFPGVVVDLASRKSVGNDVDFDDATWIADGIYGGGPTEGQYIAGGMDGTWPGDAYTDYVEEGNSYDDLLGTARDVDFDHDGLQNWQEYAVQSMRHLRYDDINTPLMGRILKEGTYAQGSFELTQNHSQKFVAPMPMDTGDPDTFAMKAVMMYGWDPADVMELMDGTYGCAPRSPAEVGYLYTQGWNMDGWRACGYFATPIHGWDRMITCLLIHPYVMLPPAGAGYCTTSPYQADSDGDGMDDFYEMFHGLNPLLGSASPGASDLIADAYGVPGLYNAFWNEWTCPDFSRPVAVGFGMPGSPNRPAALSGPEGLDPVLYPWAMGAGDVDADGDGLRNTDENLLANLTTPTSTHTDPTPMWFTDTTLANSFTAQYYVNNSTLLKLPFWVGGVGPSYTGATMDWLYSFEENEGYDTDNDWEPDGREIVKTLKSTSDPLNETDPVRRQALYLDGVNSYAMTRMPQYRADDGIDLYTQFTAECWVYPEKTGAEQTILDRASFYSKNADNKDDGAIRSNFRIGLLSDGRVYGMFDNTDAIETGLNAPVSCQIVESREILELKTWSHVALSYDGHVLRLYVNGRLVKSAPTSLKPANGVMTITQNPGNTNEFVAAAFEQLPCAFFIGARPQKQNIVSLYPVHPSMPGMESFDNVRDFFKGYVDEVRIWDGARTESEIANAYTKRFSFDDVATNRLEVYTAWADGATRNDNDGNPTLPAELCQHYNFANLPGAVSGADVAKLPVGFQKGVIGQIDDPYATNADQMNTTDLYDDLPGIKGLTADDFNVGWWGVTKLHSTVYSDYHVVPWIENTAAHLPMLDGSCWDSILYHEYLGGKYLPAYVQGIQKFVFPNSAVPYTHYQYNLERWYHEMELERAAEIFGENVEDLLMKYLFEVRTRFVGTSDLVPMGGAFAKTSTALWDGQGPSDAWEYSVVDTDDDGLPDWWEDVAAGYSPQDDELTWNTLVTYSDGHVMPAWEAYLRDLAKGMQPDGSVKSEYEAIADGDGDGLPDWWQSIFAITDGNADADGDGLSNYVEYMLSEVFDLKLRFDPTDPYSVQSHVSDYFYRVNQLYVGEIFTDHDQVKDQWEQKYMPRTTMVDPFLYDAHLDVTDINESDGWSNYAEFQAGTDPTRLSSLGIDAVTMSEHPVPTIELHLNYEGGQNTADKGIVVKAWSDPTLESIPDAVWQLGETGQTEVYENGTSNVVNGLKYIGMNPNKELLMHLSPGSVVKGSVEFEFKDLNWKLINMAQQLFYVMDGKTAIWDTLMIDKERINDTAKGDIVFKTTEEVVGEIDYDTGAVTIDFARLPENVMIVGDITGGHEGEDWLSVYTMAQCYIRTKWLSKTVTGGNRSTYYLSDADERSASNNSLGHVKEGKNTFIAFVDLDGNGEYSAGEPYGAAYDVDIGWNYGKVSIELTDTHAVSARFCCVLPGGAGEEGAGTGSGSRSGGGSAAGSSGESSSELGLSDREVLYGTQSGNLPMSRIAVGEASGGSYERVRVVRTLVDDEDVNDYGLPNRVVLDKLVNVSGERYITEADFLKNGDLDIDWETLADDIDGCYLLEGNPITNVAYRVVLGNGTTSNWVTNNLLPIVFQRSFDTEEIYMDPKNKPQTLGPGECTAVHPTFSWMMPGGLNSYTAFRIQVSGSSFNWDSGFQPMPARVRDPENGWRYEWTAPLCVNDKTTDGQVFANNANYKWRITMTNARFKNMENWSADASFRMNVLTNSLDYGTLQAAIRYYGPDAIAKSGVIRVQVFETPDFSGSPVASGYLKDMSEIRSTNRIVKANVLIPGLKAGTYYVRAFIDSEADAKRAAWESWGCFSTRDTQSGTIFTPKSVKVGPKAGTSDIVPVYIEDADTDQDGLPDAWEYATQSGATAADRLKAVGTERLSQALTGGFAMNKDLSGYIKASGRVSNGLAVLTTHTLNSLFVAAMVSGVDAERPAAEVAADLSALGTEMDAEASAVSIVGIETDLANKKVVLTVGSEVEAAGGEGLPFASAIYTFNLNARPVYCQVWGKSNVTDAEWKPVARKPVEFGSTVGTVTVDLSDLDFSNGFFTISLEQD